MNAVGGDGGHNEVARISRITAAWELTKRVRHSAALGRHVIVVSSLFSSMIERAPTFVSIDRRLQQYS